MKIASSLIVITTLSSTHVDAQFSDPHCRDLHKAEYRCPVVRYCPFDHYSDSDQLILTAELNYTERLWDSWRRRWAYDQAIEFRRFSSLSEDQQDVLSSMEYDEEKYDCCLNHYDEYYWADMEPEVQSAWELIGYEQTTWDEGGYQGGYAWDDWDDIPEDIQIVLHDTVCYTKETWDGESIPDWYDDVTVIYPGEYRDEDEDNEDSFFSRLIVAIMEILEAILALFDLFAGEED